MSTKLKAKFYVNVRDFIGKNEIEVKLDGTERHTIREVIEKISAVIGNLK